MSVKHVYVWICVVFHDRCARSALGLIAVHIWRRCLLRQGSMGLVPELTVPPPVGHVCPYGVFPLLPEDLLYQVSTGYVNHDHGAILGLPKRPVDLIVFHL